MSVLRGCPPEIKRLYAQAEAAGWPMRRGKGGRIVVYLPNGEIAYLHTSPGPWSWHDSAAAFKRALAMNAEVTHALDR